MISSTDHDASLATTEGVSFVLPCLNEGLTLEICLRKAFSAIAELGLPAEVVVADNGSTDRSTAIARRFGCTVVPVVQRGYGAALLAGLRAAKYSYIVMGDADDSYDFREAPRLIAELRSGSDLCIGSRLRGSIMPGAMPWSNRHIGTPVLTAIVNAVYGARYSDVNSGLRAMKKSAFERLHLESTGMEFASEMLIKSAVLRLRTSEVPITLHRDGRDRPPHLRPWHDGWRHLKFILLFAPRMLYWFPGTLALLAAVTLGAILNSSVGGRPVHIGGLTLNDHWIVVDALLCFVGYDLIVMGLLSHLYSVTHRLPMRTPAFDTLIRCLTIERILIAAVVLCVVGTLIEVAVFESWAYSGYGALAAIRPAVTGMVFFVLGTQTMFSGFFYAVLVDRYEQIAPVL